MVTKIGLGLAALGRPGYINLGHAVDLNHNYDLESMESHAHEIMELAYQKGIRYFDAARSYGKAEEFFQKHKCSVQMLRIPLAVKAWNAAAGKVIGMFHVTC